MIRTSILLLLITLLKQSETLVFGVNIFNLTSNYLSSPIFPSAFEDISSTETNLFTLRIVNGNQQINIRRMGCISNILSSEVDMVYSTALVNFRFIIDANIYVLPNYIAVIYKDSSLNGYRFLVDKSTLAFVSRTFLPEYYEGLYSKKFQIFFSKNSNNQIKLYEEMEGVAPVYTNVMTTQSGPIQFLLACGQTKLITFFQGANFIHVRQLEDSAKIKSNFYTYQTINLPSAGFQCFCLDTSQTRLFILLDNGVLVQINLLNNSINRSQQIYLTGYHKGFYSQHTNQTLVFIKESNSPNGSLTFINYFNLANSNQVFIQTNQLGYTKISQNQMFFFHTSNTQMALRAITNQYCLGLGTYLETNICRTCSSNCQSCTGINACTVCIGGYSLSGGQCTQCPVGNFYIGPGCSACSSNCLSCTGLSACTQCAVGYSLDGGLCSSIIANDDSSIQYIPIDVEQAITILMNNSATTLMNRIPSSRQIFFYAFYYFGNLDDLWLYQFHQRDYGKIVNTLFDSINNLENNKWEFLDIQKKKKMEKMLKLNLKEVEDSLNNRQAYSGHNYVKYQQKGQSLLSNCLYYFTLNIVFVFITFLILKGLFKLLFHYRVSKFLRPFSFWGSVGVILLDGNMQIIFFLMFSQSQLSFQTNFKDKIMATLSHLLFFFFLLFSVSCYFLYYTAYKSLAKYFLDNSKCSLNGVIAITICSTFRQLILSAIHNFLRYDYQVQLSMLFAIEILYIIAILLFYKIKKAFIHSNIIWTTLLFAFMRAIFNAILYFQQKQMNNAQIMNTFEILIKYLLFTYLLVYILGIILNFAIQIIEGLKKALKKKPSDQKQLEQKDNQQNQLQLKDENQKQLQLNDKNQKKLQLKNKHQKQLKLKDENQKQLTFNDQKQKELKFQDIQQKRKKKSKEKGKLTPEMIKKIQFKLKTTNFNYRLEIPDQYYNENDKHQSVNKSIRIKGTKDASLDNKNDRLICRQAPCFKRKNKDQEIE